MDDALRELLERLEAALRSNEEHENLRETVPRLEGLVRDLIKRLPPPV